MGKIRDRITAALPWADPLLDYFDWKKTVVAGVAAGAIGAWSFVKDLAWPIIVTLALTALVQTAYLLLFPAFVKLIHVGVKQRPNHSI